MSLSDSSFPDVLFVMTLYSAGDSGCTRLVAATEVKVVEGKSRAFCCKGGDPGLAHRTSLSMRNLRTSNLEILSGASIT